MSIRKYQKVVKMPVSNIAKGVVGCYHILMKQLAVVIFCSLFLGGCTVKELFVKSPAGLEITTTPTSTVFLNDENKGETPYSNKNMKPGNYTLKLVAIGGDNFAPYELKLSLTSKASTIINHTFAQNDLDASGYTLQLQEDLSGGTFISVISDPDTVNVTLDDKPSGFTPLSKIAATPGSHSLLITSPGYLEQTLSVNVVKGYNLIVNFKLASEKITLSPPTEATPSASLSPTALTAPTASTVAADIISKPYVLIGDTGTGWLRVRKEASGSSDELGKADTGEKLKYLGESTELGWFKVEFEGNPGWVSGKYVTLVK